ncbi:dienelactone hydrolase [Catenulispora sp. MAP12-49]|uniref:alpha/beta hydrolase n=1 Tax=Catenulispora sp. MAP12-49 TaxID=3156302 RepID=UPI0035132AEE
MEAITDPAALAARFVELAGQSRWADIEALFAPGLRAVVSADAVRAGWTSEAGPLGDLAGLGAPQTEAIDGGLTRVSVPVSFAKGDLTVVIATAGDGLLHGLRLAAPGEWTPPPYAAPKRFVEHEVVVGEGPLAVPGTLTMPRGAGPFPAAILLSGGGPFDRDGSAGPLKPLKDLAWGLAGSGVASLRFDKVSAVHGEVLAEMPEFTAADEYLPYARDAFRQLRQNPEIAPDRIHIVGHSMGAKMAPRIASAEPGIAGLVLLAADAVPMQRAVVRTVRHLATLGLVPAETVAVIEQQAANVDSPDLSSSTATEDLPLGYSGAYWLDLRSYDPVATARELPQPMLILQGGRDYQVTEADDLALWRAGLGGRADVEIRVHAADNHMFAPGTGPSTPAEYAVPANVDPAVVEDIVRWLGADAPRGKRIFTGMRGRRS